MSLIHDALRKAGKEKGKEGSLPSLAGSEGASPSPAPLKRGKRMFFFLSALLILGLVLLGVTFYFKKMIPETFPGSPPKLSPPQKEKVSSPKPPLSVPATPLVLNGIVQGEGDPFAVINNEISRLGDEINGVVLVEIGENFVVLERGEERVTLKLK